MAPADQQLRDLAEDLHVSFNPVISPEAWPAAHTRNFGNVRRLGRLEYDSYCADVGIRSHEEPWKQQTKQRAHFLSKRCTTLVMQGRNEAGWRFNLEHLVMARFSVEVAWYIT